MNLLQITCPRLTLHSKNWGYLLWLGKDKQETIEVLNNFLNEVSKV